MKRKRDVANRSLDAQIWNDNLVEGGKARSARKLGSISQVVSKYAGLSCRNQIVFSVMSRLLPRRGIVHKFISCFWGVKKANVQNGTGKRMGV
jgi:hypothetical protein